jgi:hypothetical protein
MGYMFVLDGVPLEVLDYDGADYVNVSINDNSHNTRPLPLSSVLYAMNQRLTARMNTTN